MTARRPILLLFATMLASLVACVRKAEVIDTVPQTGVHEVTSTGKTLLARQPDYLISHPEIGLVDPNDYRRIRSTEFVNFPEFSRFSGARQEIRLLRITEYKSYEAKLWLQGEGTAVVKDKGETYFWDSYTPPSLEVEVRPQGDGYASLLHFMRNGIPEGRALSISGLGHFKPIIMDRRYIGVFQIDRLDAVTLETYAPPTE